MKKALNVSFAVALCLSAAVAAAADSDTFAFYSFKDGAAGTSAVGVTLNNDVDSSLHSGTATCPDTDATASATFNSDAPGAFIYESGLESAELLCAAPQSIYVTSEANVRAGSLSFAGAATEFSKHADTGFTLEFFVWVDSSVSYANWGNTILIPAYRTPGGVDRTFLISLPYRNMGKMACGVSSLTSGDTIHGESVIPTLNNGQWHHFAFVQNADNSVGIYVDYAVRKSGTPSTVTVSEVDPGKAVTLLNNTFCGKVSCVRMTKRALGKDEFMRAANRVHSTTVTADPDALAFYPFDDGAAGTSAAGATVSSVANPQLSKGTVTVSDEATASATFDADAPGKYVFVGEHYADTPIYTNPASVFVTSEVNGSSGSITFQGLGARLSHHHDRGHTVEYFVKMVDSSFTGFVSHFSCNAGYGDSATHSAALNLYMPFAMGSSYSNGRQFRVAVGSYSGS